MTDEWEETVYFRVGIIGSAQEAFASFTFKANTEMTLSELEDAVAEKMERGSAQVSAQFGRVLFKHVAASIERHDNDSNPERGTTGSS